MGIITVILVTLVIIIPTALIEGFTALHHRAKEASEWRKLKKIYY
jgi:hypothetical protein